MMEKSLSLRTLYSAEELKACETIQQEVWGIDDLGTTPVHFFVASVHSGGLVVGAFMDEKLVGFLNAFPAYVPEKQTGVGMHSDMMAVLPAYRAQGIGKRLKWFQRDWCLSRGINWITWTFDPLQAKNARLNLEHLGAVVSEYRVNEYGFLGGGLNGDLPTDRLLAFWDLQSSRVKQLAAGENLPALPRAKASALLSSSDARPIGTDLSLGEDCISVAIPESLNDLLASNFPLALEWRLKLREVLEHYLQKAYSITRFGNKSYLLEKNNL